MLVQTNQERADTMDEEPACPARQVCLPPHSRSGLRSCLAAEPFSG